MVHLNNITTKTGDAGSTRLGDGTEVSKCDARIGALGDIDELNARLGMTLACTLADPHDKWLRQIQNDLFDLGADLCVPLEAEVEQALRIEQAHINRLELWLNVMQKKLPALESFILPGGAPVPASLHLARTVCRRAERSVWQLAETANISPLTTIYLNRLSDFLFQLARLTEDPNQPAPLWIPNKK